MSSLAISDPLALLHQRRGVASVSFCGHMPCVIPLFPLHRRSLAVFYSAPGGGVRSRRSFSSAANASALMENSTPEMRYKPTVDVLHRGLFRWLMPKSGMYTVGDFMTKKDKLQVVKPSTTVDEALEILVENRITGFPVIDDNWKLVGLVSDYDLLALDSISGERNDTSIFPEVDSSWKVFNELQTLLTKTNGKLVADVMTQAPLVVRETTNLEDAARLLLETRYRRLPVVDAGGELVGLITRGDVIRAALHIKRAAEMHQTD